MSLEHRVRVSLGPRLVDVDVEPARATIPVEAVHSVGVMGLGCVGLPTALALAEADIAVLGCDVSEERLASIREKRVDLLAADRERLDRFLGSERLTLTTENAALSTVDTVLICVPTPIDRHLVPDLTALSECCRAVVAATRPGQTIVLMSTTYVGCTHDLLVEPLRRRGLVVGEDVFVAFSPERIDPGVPAHTQEFTPRVVGGATPACTDRAVQTLSKVAAAMHAVASPEAAELTKLLENTFRAVNIALANEFSGIARHFGIDVIEVIDAAATKPYGFMPFYPGPGVGGHCIPCDPHYLLWQLKANHEQSPVTEAAMAAIAARPRAVVSRAQEVLADAGCPLAGSRVLIVGVAYKPGVADVRESPALEILEELTHRGALASYSDPLVDYLVTPTGVLSDETDPARGNWDLVIAHTLHPTVDYSWIASAPLVLDATYKLDRFVHPHVL
ncbi:nucleotide sugar dehydrogenase [Rhodococcus sp. WS4]|nr:nucleotide sugar dehydrogenase [Rhodococcus sp. WS4]